MSPEIVEPTLIDVLDVNKRRLKEIEDQANPMLQIEKSCKVKTNKVSRAMEVLE